MRPHQRVYTKALTWEPMHFSEDVEVFNLVATKVVLGTCQRKVAEQSRKNIEAV